MPARRLYVHVGLQKTGTSYLQAALLASSDDLAEQGLDLVPPTKRECYELMVVIRDRYAARRNAESDRNTLDRFTHQLRRAPGSRAVLSQESLAAAAPDQVRRLVDLAGDREVHVVATVRDLARQLPSHWQEHLKAGGTAPLGRFLRRLQAQQRAGSESRPWIHLDAPAVVRRWAEVVSPDRVHVVTVPPAGSPTTVLLERFAQVLGVEPGMLRPEDRPSNAGLGMVQAEVLRRVNLDLPEETRRRYIYGDVVKRSFGAKVLGVQERRRIQVPVAFREWCDEVTERQVAELSAAGYRVAGTWEDLRCLPSSFSETADRPSEQEVATSSVRAIADLLAARGETQARRTTGRFEVAPTGRLARLRRRLAR